MAEITKLDMVDIGDVSTYLAANYEAEGNLFGEKLAVTSPQTIQIITDALRWELENFPDSPGTRAVGYITVDTLNTTGDIIITVFVKDPSSGNNINLGSATLNVGLSIEALTTIIYNGIVGNNYGYMVSLTSSNSMSISAPLDQGSSINGGNNLFYTLYTQINTLFNVGTGFSPFPAKWLAIQSDGKILVGGDFTSYNGTAANKIIRLKEDGSVDSGFVYGSGFNTGSSIYSIAFRQDGSSVLGGFFNSYNGTGRDNLISLNTNGTINNNVQSPSVNNAVYWVEMLSDWRTIIVGNFTTVGGVTRNKIAMLGVGGGIDTSFDPVAGFSGGSPFCLAIQSNNKILVGGSFTSYNGTAAKNIVRLNLDGTIDNSFVYGSGFIGGSVSCISIQPNGKILVGGYFTSYNGTSANCIIRLNTDGSVDNSFVSGSGADSTVNSISIQLDNKILIGGDFDSYNGYAYKKIVRLYSNGSVDTSFLVGSGFSGSINSIKLYSNKIYLVGNFEQFQNVEYKHIISLNQ